MDVRPHRVRGPGDAFDEPFCRHGGAVCLGEASGGSAEDAPCIIEGAAFRRIMGLSRAESGRGPCQGALIRLMARLLLEHADKSQAAAMTGADHDL